MDFLKANTSLVLAGVWNPAILQPSWLLRHAFEVPVGQDMPVDVEITVAAAAPPKFVMDGIVFAPSREKFAILPAAPFVVEKLDKIEVLAARVLRKLPHTPISGLGHNFEFHEMHPGPEALTVFNAVQDLAALDVQFETTSTAITSSINFEGRLLNLTRTLKGNQLVIRMNFHYQVENAEDAAGRMRPEHGLLRENFGFAQRVLRRLYGAENITFEEAIENAA